LLGNVHSTPKTPWSEAIGMLVYNRERFLQRLGYRCRKCPPQATTGEKLYLLKQLELDLENKLDIMLVVHHPESDGVNVWLTAYVILGSNLVSQSLTSGCA
jgi:hypothetical protein